MLKISADLGTLDFLVTLKVNVGISLKKREFYCFVFIFVRGFLKQIYDLINSNKKQAQQ
tara:strand:+ start:356 stop:532 length:177 start_codon:yes stop_codon:yes gene_type:complete